MLPFTNILSVEGFSPIFIVLHLVFIFVTFLGYVMGYEGKIGNSSKDVYTAILNWNLLQTSWMMLMMLNHLYVVWQACSLVSILYSSLVVCLLAKLEIWYVWREEEFQDGGWIATPDTSFLIFLAKIVMKSGMNENS